MLLLRRQRQASDAALLAAAARRRRTASDTTTAVAHLLPTHCHTATLPREDACKGAPPGGSIGHRRTVHELEKGLETVDFLPYLGIAGLELAV